MTQSFSLRTTSFAHAHQEMEEQNTSLTKRMLGEQVRLSPKTGLDETTRASLEDAIAEALDVLSKQDSPFARTLVDEVQRHLDLDEVQERMLDQARTWQERSSSLQERVDRARNRRA